MRVIECSCPACGVKLRVKAQATARFRAVCPKCQHAFSRSSGDAGGPAPAGSAASGADDLFGDLPFDEFSAPALPAASTGGRPARNLLPGPAGAKSRSARRPMRFLVAAAAAGAVCALAAGIILLVWNLAGSSLGNLAGGRLAFDSAARVTSDAEALGRRVERHYDSIDESDQSAATAAAFRGFLREYDELLMRACRLAPVAKNVDDVMAELEARVAAARSAGAANMHAQPHDVWRLRRGGPDLEVNVALNQLVNRRTAVGVALGAAAWDLTDPLKYSGANFSWDDEERHAMAAVWLRGKFHRDASRAIAHLDFDRLDARSLLPVHQVLDRYARQAREIGDRPGGFRLLIRVPTGTPYSLQQIAAEQMHGSLVSALPPAAQENPELAILLDQIARMDDLLDGWMHGRGADVLSELTPSAEVCRALLVERQEQLAAEQRRQEEQERLREEEQRRLEAELARRQAEEAQRQAEQLSRRQAAEAAGEASSPGRPGPPPGPGQGFARRGGPFGPRGAPPAGPPSGPRRGPPDLGPPGGFAPERSGRGPDARPGRSQAPGGRGGSADAREATNVVTIQAEDVGRLDGRTITQDLPQWLRAGYPVSIHVSNGRLTITVERFDRPLSDLEECFPALEFLEIDEPQRVIVAQPAP